MTRTGDEDPEQLLANPRNWRVHPRHQEEALQTVLTNVGWVQRVIVNERTGYVVDGHLRVAHAISRGEKSVPVQYVDLDDAEERLILASLDPIGAMAGTDKDLLEQLLASVETSEDSARSLLVDVAKQRHVRLPGGGLTPENAAPAVPEMATRVSAGDVYTIGRHRIMCGDSTNPLDVARLLAGEQPYLLVTDPPYGVSYDPSWRDEAAARGDLQFAARRAAEVPNDDRADWTPALELAPGSVAYVWHAGVYASEIQASLERAGYAIRNQIIWSKPHFVISRGHYNWQHEPCWFAVRPGENESPEQASVRTHTPCWYAVKPSATAQWAGDQLQSTVWEIPLDANVAGGHSTQKPVEAMRRPIQNHRGDVYDPFVGTGTTVIAAEQLGRRSFAMDIDPRFVEVAIRRLELYTGLDAEKD